MRLSQLSAAFQAPQDNKSTVLLALAGGAGAIAALGLLASRSKDGYKRKPSSFEISGGAVDAKKVKDTVRPSSAGRRQLGPMAMQRQPKGGGHCPPAVRLAAGRQQRRCCSASLLSRCREFHVLLGRYCSVSVGTHRCCRLQVQEYYGEYNTLERGKGAVMKESQKVWACAALGAVPSAGAILVNPSSQSLECCCAALMGAALLLHAWAHVGTELLLGVLDPAGPPSNAFVSAPACPLIQQL